MPPEKKKKPDTKKRNIHNQYSEQKDLNYELSKTKMGK